MTIKNDHNTYSHIISDKGQDQIDMFIKNISNDIIVAEEINVELLSQGLGEGEYQYVFRVGMGTFRDGSGGAYMLSKDHGELPVSSRKKILGMIVWVDEPDMNNFYRIATYTLTPYVDSITPARVLIEAIKAIEKQRDIRKEMMGK